MNRASARWRLAAEASLVHRARILTDVPYLTSTSLTRPPARQRASRASSTLQVAIKPRLSSALPVSTPIIVSSRPGMKKTEEDVPRRSDDNSRVPRPHHQIPGLRLRYSLKSLDPVVETVGTRIGVWKARSLVNRMHQMRAVALGVARRFRIERGGNHCQPIVRTQRPFALSPTPTSGCIIRRGFRKSLPRICRRRGSSIINNRSSPLLRPRYTKRRPAEPNHNRGLSPIPHCPILMQIPPPALVTIVQRLRLRIEADAPSNPTPHANPLLV